jgi:hypothetical protein
VFFFGIIIHTLVYRLDGCLQRYDTGGFLSFGKDRIRILRSVFTYSRVDNLFTFLGALREQIGNM